MSSPGIEANADLMLMESEAGDTLPYRPLNILRPPFLDSVPPLHTWPDDLCRDVVPEGVGRACMRVGRARSVSWSVFALSFSFSLYVSLSRSVSLSLSCALSRARSVSPLKTRLPCLPVPPFRKNLGKIAFISLCPATAAAGFLGGGHISTGKRHKLTSFHIHLFMRMQADAFFSRL
jgi:hypothetical protein